jgi:hypothetical protein
MSHDRVVSYVYINSTSVPDVRRRLAELLDSWSVYAAGLVHLDFCLLIEAKHAIANFREVLLDFEERIAGGHHPEEVAVVNALSDAENIVKTLVDIEERADALAEALIGLL